MAAEQKIVSRILQSLHAMKIPAKTLWRDKVHKKFYKNCWNVEILILQHFNKKIDHIKYNMTSVW